MLSATSVITSARLGLRQIFGLTKRKTNWSVKTEQSGKIGIAEQSWLREPVELMAWSVIQVVLLNGIQ